MTTARPAPTDGPCTLAVALHDEEGDDHYTP
jgi:hypothetical protein